MLFLFQTSNERSCVSKTIQTKEEISSLQVTALRRALFFNSGGSGPINTQQEYSENQLKYPWTKVSSSRLSSRTKERAIAEGRSSIDLYSAGTGVPTAGHMHL